MREKRPHEPVYMYVQHADEPVPLQEYIDSTVNIYSVAVGGTELLQKFVYLLTGNAKQKLRLC